MNVLREHIEETSELWPDKGCNWSQDRRKLVTRTFCEKKVNLFEKRNALDMTMLISFL